MNPSDNEQDPGLELVELGIGRIEAPEPTYNDGLHDAMEGMKAAASAALRAGSPAGSKAMHLLKENKDSKPDDYVEYVRIKIL
ncbi:hypothetical protein ACFOLG_07995 [Vogesella facilis]|uniref:Uncharacterized protein n=1 Tax=Vogesella facilis TaxID=1655232 RepID=A0ABV7RFR3_9NEIS